MTSEEHDSLYPMSRYPLITDNYIKVDKLIHRLSGMYPDDPYAHVGTVPERLAHLLGRLTGDPTMFADMVYPIETPNADDVACAEDPITDDEPYYLKDDFRGISKGDLALVCMYGYKALPADHPLWAYGSTSAVLSHEANEQMEKLRVYAERYVNDHPTHTPMAYEHTEKAPFVDVINEAGYIGHEPIGTVVDESDDKPKVNEGVPLDISWAFTEATKEENGEKVSVGVDTSPLGSDQPPF